MFLISFSAISFARPQPTITSTTFINLKQLINHQTFPASALSLKHTRLLLHQSQPAPLPSITKEALKSLLQHCSQPNQLKQIHTLLLTTGLSRKNSLLTQLLLTLTVSGDMNYARQLFDEMHRPRTFLWNSIIRGYVKNNLSAEAIAIYRQMHCIGIRPDSFTFPFVLKACTAVAALWMGMLVHALLVRFGLAFDIVTGTELMIMYAKFGELGSADYVFQRLSNHRDLISWNALIAVCAQTGHADKALWLFRQMDSSGMKPDSVTLVSVLNACACLGCLEMGKEIHRCIVEQRLDTNVYVENAILDMYAKCGNMDMASRLFSQMHDRNVISWSTMIGGYAMNGENERALSLFSQMQDQGVQPNHVTLLAVISACSHAGLVNQGRNYFYSIVNPRIEHYASMVDLLGRSGHLEEAYEFIKRMHIEPDAGVWGALLGACTIHHNMELGQFVADQLFSMAPEAASYHVLLSNIYAAAGRWTDVESVRERMRENSMKKVAAYSSVELGGEVHLFHCGDRTHPRSKDIYEKLEELIGQLKGMGYEPKTSVVLHDLEIEEKEVALGTHSEKIAIVFGLISSGPKSPIRVMKNLRVCKDCHTFSKFVSRLVRREIIMRDKNRFHHFKDGICSCLDFW